MITKFQLQLRSSFVGASFLLAILVVTSCASYTEQTTAIHQDFISSKYQSALDHLDKSGLDPDSKNGLLYFLEKALILDRMDNLESSRKLLLQADIKADQLYTKSLSKQIASYIVSEDQTEYAGEDYERIAIHTFLALSFLEQGRLNEARVEARKINNKSAEINQQYSENENRYKEDGFAWLLSGLIYEARGEYDDAIIDYVKALNSYESRFSRYSAGIPEALIMSLANVATIRNRLEILKRLSITYPSMISRYKLPLKGFSYVFMAERGSILRKRSESFFIEINNQIVRYSWPVLEKPVIQSRYPAVRLGGDQIPFQEAINFSSIASDSLEDKRLRFTVKSFARLTAKAAIIDNLEKKFGPLGGFLANVFFAFTETADTRSWTLLPNDIGLARVQSETAFNAYQIEGENMPILKTSGDIGFVRIK